MTIDEFIILVLQLVHLCTHATDFIVLLLYLINNWAVLAGTWAIHSLQHFEMKVSVQELLIIHNINFHSFGYWEIVHKLASKSVEVLDLSFTRIGDKTLIALSNTLGEETLWDRFEGAAALFSAVQKYPRVAGREPEQDQVPAQWEAEPADLAEHRAELAGSTEKAGTETQRTHDRGTHSWGHSVGAREGESEAGCSTDRAGRESSEPAEAEQRLWVAPWVTKNGERQAEQGIDRRWGRALKATERQQRRSR